MAKTKAKRSSKCTPKVIERICILIERKAKWKEIAKVIEIAERTLEYWRDPDSEHYKPELVEAIEATQEKMSCGLTKADQHRQSQFHYLKKVTRERQLIDVRTEHSRVKLPPPAMPPASFSTASIISYADEVLDLILDPKYTKDEMRVECRKRINELTTEIFAKIKEEISESEPNQQAVKNVLNNCGPEEERWNFKDEHEHDVTDKLGKLLTEIGATRSVLPKQEEIGNYKEEEDEM